MEKKFIWRMALCAVMLCAVWPGGASASTKVDQTWLQGDQIFNTIKFQSTLPVFGPGYNKTLPRVNAVANPFLNVTMKEIDQQVLPGYGPTRVWAYEISNSLTGKVLGPAHWPAVTIENRRHSPTVVKYVNELPSFGEGSLAGGGLVQGLVTTDKSIHWADPYSVLNPPEMGMNPCMDNPGGTDQGGFSCSEPYLGPVPTVIHLHGGETLSSFDGGPEQWFTPTGLRGKDYRSLYPTSENAAVYLYNNFQEPGTLWFHDHALGATRTNVYSGLAAFYFLRDASAEPKNLPSGAYEIEMAIQDRQFDTNGQLFFPDGSPNDNTLAACGDGSSNDPCINGPVPNPAIHPFWIPEFFGDVAIVNGAPWPILNVEPRRYLFRLLDGSNARFYSLTFGTGSEQKPKVYMVGMDDNYLDAPVDVTSNTAFTQPGQDALPTQVFIAPGERAYAIVDFTGLSGTVTVTNNAFAPFPSGLQAGVDAAQVAIGTIMQFNVSLDLKGQDTSCNPAAGGCKRPFPIVRLSDANGGIADGVNYVKKRQIVLKEHEADGPPGGPLEVFVNNTRWDGLRSPSIAAIFGTDGVSELPRVGSIELWEIINLTMDAHPMHTHLVQFQVLNRQPFNSDQYNIDWAAAFPAATSFSPDCIGGVFCPGYGPPMPYNVLNADGALGGNLPLQNGATNYLAGTTAIAPKPEESGWKDTAKAYPGMVTRFLIRWTPTHTDNKLARPGRNLFPFDPTQGPGYVWHCHIVDHEDNEMMRPYKVVK